MYSEYGMKEESLWVGHSIQTFKDHYSTTTEEEFKKAAARKFIKPVDNPGAKVITEIMHDNQN